MFFCFFPKKEESTGEEDGGSEPDVQSESLCVFAYEPPWLKEDKTMVFASGRILCWHAQTQARTRSETHTPAGTVPSDRH